jgi:peroxiredoxin
MSLQKTFFVFLFFISSQFCFSQLKKGQSAPSITLSNASDSSVSLSSFKGKVVLLDFWASWCGPCRQSNPALVKLYDEFKNQGFEIVAVSLDQNRKAWLQAIKQDGLTYTQLLDARGADSEVANTYGISEIPTSFLIDKQGRLQERNLHGKVLKNRIIELLKN